MIENNFNGTWMHVKNKDFYGRIYCIEFQKDKIVHFNIETKKEQILQLAEDGIIEKISEVKYEFINQNRLRFLKKGFKSSFYSDKVVTVEIDIENDFIRFEPTKSSLTNEEIESFRYAAKWNDQNLKITFNEILDPDYIQEMNKRVNIEGRKIMLEQFGDTLFLSFFENNQRDKIMPIKEIDQDKIIFSGFPTQPYEAIGVRIK